MPDVGDIWLPLVDEPIGGIVEQIQRENPDIDGLVNSPHRLLAFRTFAYIRVGIALGEVLFEDEVPPYDGSDEWVENLLRDHGEALTQEVRAVAEEIAAEPRYAGEEQLGPDQATRARTRAAFLERLDGGT